MPDQVFSAPVLADKREQTMLDLISLAGPRWEMAYADRESRLVGQPLQFPLPQPHPGPIAATPIRRNQHPLRLRIARLSCLLPPAPNALDGKSSGIMIDSHVDPPRIGGQVVDSVRAHAAQFGDH